MSKEVERGLDGSDLRLGKGWRRAVWVVWALSALALAIWAVSPGYVAGWDLAVYENAVASVRAGHDPYLDGMAVQRVYHAEAVHPPGAPTPFTYVYSPMTLPVIRAAAALPLLLDKTLYWLLYVAAVLAVIWVSTRFVEAGERRVFWLFAPLSVFFPGLLENDVIFCGNVAFLLYGAVFVAAWVGWKRGRWGWFYAAVLLASCFKAPLLSLLAIPVFSSRRTWWPAAATGAAGFALFALQPVVWPVLFRHYLEAVELQFSFNRDFSSSAAGLAADALYDVVPYQVTSAGMYLVCAALVVAALVPLARRYQAGLIPLSRWSPVLLVGTLLLNPRIMEYDAAPMTFALGLLLWRFVQRGQGLLRATVLCMALLGASMGATRDGHWRATECLLLIGLFAVGCWDLYSLSAVVRPVERQMATERKGALV